MNKKAPVGLLFVALALGPLVVMPTHGQSPYFQAVTNLNPVGYWPMHEIEAPAPGNIETNYGTLGVLGNGYYNDWTTLPGTYAKIVRQVPGPVVSPPDTGTFFTNNAGRTTTAGYLMVPNVSSVLALKPPFTIEGWALAAYQQVGTFSTIMGQGGAAGLNASPNFTGWSLNWNNPGGNNGPIYNMYAWGGSGSSQISGCANAPTTPVTSTTWYYFAYVFTTNNTSTCVANGAINASSTQLNPPLPPTIWSPLFLGTGRNGNTGPGGFSFDGALAELAVYTNALSADDFAAHYNAGTNASPATNYFQLVTNGNPIIYFRMNAPAYTPPDVSTWPVLANYGTVAANGVYTPGTLPGFLTGLPASSYPVNVSNQVALLSGMGTFADAGDNPSYNPTGSSATFSVSALFRGNPTDPRTQSIVGHGTNSWMLGLTTSGRVVFNSGTNSSAPTATGTGPGDLVGASTNNDGVWHHVVAVHNQTTNFLYVDGVPVATNVSTASIPGNTRHVMIAADPSYTNANDNLGRQFSGQVCEVAFFTNALAASDVQSLYAALGVIPLITQQPVSTSVNAGNAFTNPVAVRGSPALAYRWYFNTSSNYTGATAMTNTLDGRILGTATAALIFTNVRGSDAGYYFAVVTNNYGAITSSVVSLAVSTSPTITAQLPVTYTNLITLFVGANPTFSVRATGASPLAYYWYTNGVVAGGATNAAYALTNAQATSPTSFMCIVSNFLGTATSTVWSVSYIATPTAPYPHSVLTLNPIAYWRMNEPDDYAGNQGAICHDYVGGNNGLYTNVNLAQPGYNPVADGADTAAQFGYFSANNSYAGQVGTNIDFSTPSGSNAAFSVAAWVNGSAYSQHANAGIVAKGYFNGEEFSLDEGAPSANFRFEVRGANGTAYNANSTVNAYSTGWHFLVGTCDEASGIVSIYVDGVLSGSASIPAGAGIINSAAVPVMIGARATSAVSGADNQFLGVINDVVLYRSVLSASQVYYQYTNSGVAPFFTQEPPGFATVPEGGTLTVSAAADGTEPLAYQWQDTYGNTSLLANQTNATLMLTNVSLSLDGDSFTLTVTNVYGSRDSTPVVLSVVSGPPQITASNLPPQVTLLTGQSYTYSVTAIGSLPFSYQWYFGASPVAGQTNATYLLTAAAPGTAIVSVVITNIHGAITGADSTVTVLARSTNAYAAAVLGYGPVGYWPLQETNPPAPANMETNLGTLGKLGNAYYAATNASNVTFGLSGVTADADLAVAFSGVNGVTPTSYAFVPRVTPALTMSPPLSYEAWINSSSTQFGDIIGQGGSGLNSPSGGGNWAGIRMAYGGNATGGPNLQAYAYDGNGSEVLTFTTPPNSLPLSAWHHCLLTFDGSTGILYIDGTQAASGALTMVPDTWSPLTIGAGRWQGSPPAPTRGLNGIEDEVAVYTNVLSANQVTNHYLAATSAGNYVQTVLADHPLLYYRMDNPAYIAPDPNLYPTALNYGLSSVNGGYASEIVPGGVSGPSIASLGTNGVAAPINGVFSCVDAGFDPAFNPTGTQPFTAMAWFRTYPSDGRVQTIMSHGANWSLNLDGATGHLVWNPGVGTVTSTGTLNDGTWHLAAGVYDGTRNYLYVDGALDNSSTASGTVTGDTSRDLYLGGNAAYVLVGVNQQYFAGAVAQAAFYTNALTADQNLQIYRASFPTISITRSGANVRLTYTGTQLLSATNVAGPYSPVPGASSPYTIPATNAQTFYRAQQ